MPLTVKTCCRATHELVTSCRTHVENERLYLRTNIVSRQESTATCSTIVRKFLVEASSIEGLSRDGIL